ncbi:hypothetical protein EDB83DRAFT_2477419 [Lactarius deliciosus]|nr:hypothetical protein EDB83DRAFT_2477419 [Lactarius deliciosus]
MPICFRRYLLALICFASVPLLFLTVPLRASTVYLDLDCCWSSLVALRCPLARFSWLLAHTEPSLSTCTFIVPSPPN